MFRWPTKGYAFRPRNVLKPLRVMLELWRTEGTDLPVSSRCGIEAQNHWGTAPRRQLHVSVWWRPVWDPQDIKRVHVKRVHVRVSCSRLIVAEMRSCLNGTGYKLGPWERTLGHLAYLTGNRGDRVYFDRPNRNFARAA
jgi:hypothetical protein